MDRYDSLMSEKDDSNRGTPKRRSESSTVYPTKQRTKPLSKFVS